MTERRSQIKRDLDLSQMFLPKAQHALPTKLGSRPIMGIALLIHEGMARVLHECFCVQSRRLHFCFKH